MSQRPSSYLLIGIHSVDSALTKAPQQLTSITMAQECRNPRVRELLERARAQGIRVGTESRAVLDRRSEEQRHQDVIAEFEAANIGTEKDLDNALGSIEGVPLVLVLDGVQDPHNLGACMRTADAAGVDAIVVPRHGAAGLGSTVSKVAAGAAEVLPFASVGNLARVAGWLKDYGVTVLGTSDKGSQSLYDTDLDRPLALIMGREHTGLGRRLEGLCDELVSLPMRGTVSSLNVSVATGVFLYEINRQRLASAAPVG